MNLLIGDGDLNDVTSSLKTMSIEENVAEVKERDETSDLDKEDKNGNYEDEKSFQKRGPIGGRPVNDVGIWEEPPPGQDLPARKFIRPNVPDCEPNPQIQQNMRNITGLGIHNKTPPQQPQNTSEELQFCQDFFQIQDMCKTFPADHLSDFLSFEDVHRSRSPIEEMKNSPQRKQKHSNLRNSELPVLDPSTIEEHLGNASDVPPPRPSYSPAAKAYAQQAQSNFTPVQQPNPSVPLDALNRTCEPPKPPRNLNGLTNTPLPVTSYSMNGVPSFAPPATAKRPNEMAIFYPGQSSNGFNDVRNNEPTMATTTAYDRMAGVRMNIHDHATRTTTNSVSPNCSGSTSYMPVANNQAYQSSAQLPVYAGQSNLPNGNIDPPAFKNTGLQLVSPTRVNTISPPSQFGSMTISGPVCPRNGTSDASNIHPPFSNANGQIPLQNGVCDSAQQPPPVIRKRDRSGQPNAQVTQSNFGNLGMLQQTNNHPMVSTNQPQMTSPNFYQQHFHQLNMTASQPVQQSNGQIGVSQYYGACNRQSPPALSQSCAQNDLHNQQFSPTICGNSSPTLVQHSNGQMSLSNDLDPNVDELIPSLGLNDDLSLQNDVVQMPVGGLERPQGLPTVNNQTPISQSHGQIMTPNNQSVMKDESLLPMSQPQWHISTGGGYNNPEFRQASVTTADNNTLLLSQSQGAPRLVMTSQQTIPQDFPVAAYSQSHSPPNNVNAFQSPNRMAQGQGNVLTLNPFPNNGQPLPNPSPPLPQLPTSVVANIPLTCHDLAQSTAQSRPVLAQLPLPSQAGQIPIIVIQQQVPVSTETKKERPILPKPSPQASGQMPHENQTLFTNGIALPVRNQTGLDTTGQRKTADKQRRANAGGKQPSKRLLNEREKMKNKTKEDLQSVDEDGDTPLHLFVCKDNITSNQIQAFLERANEVGLDNLVNARNRKGQTALYLAVTGNRHSLIPVLLKFGADVNTLVVYIDSNGSPTEERGAIHIASGKGKDYRQTLKELLKAKNIDINLPTSAGWTALHIAVQVHGTEKNGNVLSSVEIVKDLIAALIKNKADHSPLDAKYKKTPLMYAVEKKGAINLVKAILDCFDGETLKTVIEKKSGENKNALELAEEYTSTSKTDVWTLLWERLKKAGGR